MVASLLALVRALEEEAREQLYSIVSRTSSFYDSVLSSYDPTVLVFLSFSFHLFLSFSFHRFPLTRERATWRLHTNKPVVVSH